MRTTLATLRRRGDAGSGSRRLRAAAAFAALLLAVAGCATGTLDQNRHHLITAGLGSASLDGGPLDLHGSWAVHGAYDYRLTEPDGWLAVSARMVTYTVLGSSVTGEGVTRPCDLFWASAGPAIGLQVPANYPVSLVGDAGVALAHVSRKGCSDPGRNTTTTAGVPQLGFGLLMGMSPHAAWKLGGRYVRLPLDDVGVGSEPRWASAGELSLVLAF